MLYARIDDPLEEIRNTIYPQGESNALSMVLTLFVSKDSNWTSCLFIFIINLSNKLGK